VVTEEERESLAHTLEEVEQRSGKGNVKWHKSSQSARAAYFAAMLCQPLFRRSLFFETFQDSKKYIELTAFATAKAILRRARGIYEATVYVDGFRKRELEQFTRGLQALRVRKRKVRGVKRDENDACVRLANAVCGLVRDAESGNVTAQDALRMLMQKHIITAL